MSDAETTRPKAPRQRENAFTAYNFMELELAERDRAVYRLEIRRESRNPYGMVHGGALYTLADDAAGMAAHGDGRHYVTQHGDLYFLDNRSRGTIRAEGRVRRRDGPLSWWMWTSPTRPGPCWRQDSSPISAWTRREWPSGAGRGRRLPPGGPL